MVRVKDERSRRAGAMATPRRISRSESATATAFSHLARAGIPPMEKFAVVERGSRADQW